MNYIFFSLSTAFFFALTFFFRKLAGKNLSLSTAYFIETCTQMIIMLIVFLLISPDIRKGFEFKSKGLTFAILAGIMVVIGVLCNYLALKNGAFAKVVSLTSPVQIIIGVLLAILLAGDSLNVKQITGIIISIAGIYLVIAK